MKMKLEMFNEAGAHLNGRLTLKAGATIVRGDVLKFSEGKVVPCTAADDEAIGIALDGATTDTMNDLVPVACLGNFTGTVVLKAKGAITAGAKVTAAGTQAEAGDATIGVALEAATASGDLIEIAHCVRTEGAAGVVAATIASGAELPEAADYIGQPFLVKGADNNNGLYIATGTTTPGWKAVSHAS